MFELISKIIKAKKENRLNLTLRLKLFKFIKSLKYIFFDPANEYPVPKDKFKLILRSPDIWSSFPSGKIDHFMEDIFIYLYEKKINNKNR